MTGAGGEWLADHTAEIAALDERYGPAARHVVDLPPVCRAAVDGRKRAAEVCMVVRRRSGLVITGTKTFYPGAIQRLLTGGLERGEKILDAVLREAEEETGLQTEVDRFIAIVDYRVPPDPARFRTYAFVLDERQGTLGKGSDDEIAAFAEIPVEALPAMADALERLGGVRDHPGSEWEGWGRFRAVVHRVVHGVLVGEAS